MFDDNNSDRNSRVEATHILLHILDYIRTTEEDLDVKLRSMIIVIRGLVKVNPSEAEKLGLNKLLSNLLICIE